MELAKQAHSPEMNNIERVLIQGDLSKLHPEERVYYYKKVCESVGLNPLTKPFEYITLNGKLVLYALRAATDQIRSVKGVSLQITSRELIGDVYTVTARAKMGDREDESTGAVSVASLKGETLANAYMKAETKAKRRVTLSICGLGMLDETEVESIARPNHIPAEQPGENDGVIPPPPSMVSPGEYAMTFGKYNRRKLREIGPRDVESYLDYIDGQIKKKGEQPKESVAEFMQYAIAYLDECEKQMAMTPGQTEEEHGAPPF